MLNKKIPFYEAGRISQIKEDDKKYVVDRYSYNKNKYTTFYITKNNKNLLDLLDNYYGDLARYLDLNRDRYEYLKKNNMKNYEDLKNLGSYKFVLFILSLIPIAICVINPLLSNLLFLELLFIPSFVAMAYGSRKYEMEKKNNKFVNDYNNYKKDVELYSRGRAKANRPTVYSSVKMNKNKNKEIDINLKKERKIA